MKTSCFLAALLVGATTAFTSPAVGVVTTLSQRGARTTALDAVIDIGSEDAFDKTIKKAGGGVVVIDYSTTWCGPCKGVCVCSWMLSSSRLGSAFLVDFKLSFFGSFAFISP